MFLTHKLNAIMHLLHRSSHLCLGLLVVGLYLVILQAFPHTHSEQHQSLTDDNKLQRVEHVALLQIPEHQASSSITLVAASEPAKYFSFDDFMKTYAGDAPQTSLPDNSTVLNKPTGNKADIKTAPSVTAAVAPKTNSAPPAKTVSDPQTNLPAADDFSTFMKSQPEPTISTPDIKTQDTAELLIKNTLNSNSVNSERSSLGMSSPKQSVTKESLTTPRLLIAETAQSLNLPQTVISEIVREEASSPGGLNTAQVRKLIAMMINEATELQDAQQQLAAGRLARFALIVAEEASLTSIKNDPELTSLLYLARTISTHGQELPVNKQPAFEPADSIIETTPTSPVAKPALPEISPEAASKFIQHAKANEAMVLPGFTKAPQTSNIQHPINTTSKNNPFQSATYSNELAHSNQPKSTFQPFEMAPHASNHAPVKTPASGNTGYLAFPETDAPHPPAENLATAADPFSQEEVVQQTNGITVKDQMIEIPEHVSYGIMLGMFLMIFLLLFRRR